jgi:Rieske Fe-S protein
MTNGTLAGRLSADSVGGLDPAPWAAMMDAGRFDLGRSLRRFAGLNAEVAVQMVGGHAGSVLRRPSPSRRDGICPHLAGVLTWNALERTWDCPLHGSRFGADGGLLQGPAVEDLEPK